MMLSETCLGHMQPWSQLRERPSIFPCKVTGNDIYRNFGMPQFIKLKKRTHTVKKIMYLQYNIIFEATPKTSHGIFLYYKYGLLSARVRMQSSLASKLNTSKGIRLGTKYTPSHRTIHMLTEKKPV
jgi:hypothetical protein